MSDPLTNIRNSFTAKLQEFPTLPPVAWENVAFTPVVGVLYIKPVLNAGEPFKVEIGINGINRHSGIYQISIYAPAGKGINAANSLASSLCDHFKCGLKLTSSGVLVIIQKSYSSQAIQDTDRIMIPITIQYRCDAEN